MSGRQNQRTIAGPGLCAGIALHSGLHVRLGLKPAPAESGIVFIRTDIRDRDNRVPARAERVVSTRLNTEIGNAAGATVSTIEHLMAAFAAVGVDNAVVELDGPECPIMDGSALPFVELLDRVGLRTQDAVRRTIEILEPVGVVSGDKRAALVPAARFEVAFQLSYPCRAIGVQSVDLEVTEASFRSELMAARTFGFLHEVEALRARGLARGGSFDNAVVLDGDAVMNPGGLRMEREFVRHKALDAVGDLYTLGAPIRGRFETRFGGHALNNALCRALLDQPRAWRWRPALQQDLARAS